MQFFQTELSQSLQSLSEKAKAGTEFIQGLKAMTDKVHVSYNVRLSVSLHSPMTKHGRRNRGGGAQGARAPPPIILPSEIFLTQYALLSRKLAHKNFMFIFNKIFRLASLADQNSTN